MGSQIHPSRQIDAGTPYGHNSIVSENVRVGDLRESVNTNGKPHSSVVSDRRRHSVRV